MGPECSPHDSPRHSVACMKYEPIATARQLAQALDRAIQDQGLTRAEVSRRMNIPASIVSRWFANLNGIPLDQAAKVAHAINRRIVYRLEVSK